MRLVLILLIVFIVSCNSNGSKTDTDSVPDKDLVSDTDSQDTTPDEKADPDMIDIDNEKPDEDVNVPCLDLKVQANVIKTGFPFKDKNGKPTFCRPGCDTPTETDPQCVRNVWEWDNWEKYQEYLAAEKKDPEQKLTRECYPWPCVLPDMKAETQVEIPTFTSKCDRWLTVNNFSSSGGAVWSHGISSGVAGMNLNNLAIEYDPEKDIYTSVGQAMGMLSFSQDRYVVSVFDSKIAENPNYKSFVISVLRKDGKYYYELIYDNENHNAFMSNPSFAGKDWVVIQIRDGKEGNNTEVKYAKVGEWEWHDLGLGVVEEGNIVGNHLTFMIPYTNPDRQIYYCDLSKYPKSYKECTKVTGTLESGEAEQGHSPRIDEDNENRLIYYIYNKPGTYLKEVIFKENGSPEIKEYPAGRSCQPGKIKGNLMIFTGVEEGATPIGCWYRFDKQKTYCYDEPWATTGKMDMLFNTFDGKWHLWKTTYNSFIRDMDCYCKEEGVCPFEE